MKKLLIACGLVVLVVLALTTQLPSTADSPRLTPGVASLRLSTPHAALVGMWTRTPGTHPAFQLVVHRVHPGWADVVVAWGDVFPIGTFPYQTRARAKLLDEGGCHVATPMHMTFILSEDRNTLVGTRLPFDHWDSVVLVRQATRTALAQTLPLPE